MHKIEVLQPSTTRDPRGPTDTEYDFVSKWIDANYAWSIPVGTKIYGMRKSELKKAESRVCVTVFEPTQLHVFENARKSLGMETMTVGLDTVADLAEQHSRVGNDANRIMTAKDLQIARKVVSECNAVISGDADVVAEALLAMIKILNGRGGMLTHDVILPLVRAQSLVASGDESLIRSASYDLRIGREILCQGKMVELTDANPRFEIPPYSYAIVSAMETASLPPFVSGRFDLKVSYFFEGMILSNGPQVDPGYKGALFCMLYNGSGKPKLLTLGAHFATIDFTTTVYVTEGYRQKYQLQERMAKFVTDNAITGKGGAIVKLVDDKVDVVNRKIKKLRRNFWTGAAIFTGVAVLFPALTIPIAWNEIDKIRAERVEIDDARKREATQLMQAESDRRAAMNLLDQVRRLSVRQPLLASGRHNRGSDR